MPRTTLREFTAGDHFAIGPFSVRTRLLPHYLVNAGVRLTADGTTVAYTGDTGPSDEVVALARDADLLLTEATYADEVPAESEGYLSGGRIAGEQAAKAQVGQLVLTHLQPGLSPAVAYAPPVRTPARSAWPPRDWSSTCDRVRVSSGLGTR